MRKKIIAGNWKMFKTIPEAVRLAKQIDQRLQKNPTKKVVNKFCPPNSNKKLGLDFFAYTKRANRGHN